MRLVIIHQQESIKMNPVHIVIGGWIAMMIIGLILSTRKEANKTKYNQFKDRHFRR
jgi:hypothetical protein